MDLSFALHPLVPSWTSVSMLLGFFAYSAIAGSVVPGKIVPGVILSDGTRLHYRCNGLFSLLLLIALLGIGVQMNFISATAIADTGLELLSATLIFSFLVTLVLYVAGCRSRDQGSSLKPRVTGSLIHDWWFGIQLNPEFMGIDLKFFFVRAGMMGWLLINLSILAKSVKDANLSQSMILYQIFCVLYILDYFFHEEYMTSTRYHRGRKPLLLLEKYQTLLLSKNICQNVVTAYRNLLLPQSFSTITTAQVSSGDAIVAGTLRSIAWFWKLLDAYLCCKAEFKAVLVMDCKFATHSISLSHQSTAASLSSYELERALDVSSAIAYCVDLVRHLQELVQIAVSALKQLPIRGGQVRHAKNGFNTLLGSMAFSE